MSYTVRKLSRKNLRCPSLSKIGCFFSPYAEQKIFTLCQWQTSVVFEVACFTVHWAQYYIRLWFSNITLMQTKPKIPLKLLPEFTNGICPSLQYNFTCGWGMLEFLNFTLILMKLVRHSNTILHTVRGAWVAKFYACSDIMLSVIAT